MRCRYCKTENFGSAEICIACGEPISPSNHEHEAAASEDVAKTRADNVVSINGGINASGDNPDSIGMPFETFRSAAPATPEKTNAPNFSDTFAKTQSAGTTQSSGYGGFEQSDEQDMPQSAGAASFESASGSHASPFTHPLFDNLEKQSMPFSEEGSIFPTKFAKLTVIISCSAIVIGAVLGGAWWMKSSVVVQPLATITNSGQPSKVTIAEPSKKTFAQQARGISAAELPYDGAQPTSSTGDSAHASVTIKPEELPYDGKALGTTTKDDKLALNDAPSLPSPVGKTPKPATAKTHASNASTRSAELKPARRAQSEGRYNTDKATWRPQAGTRARVMQCNNINSFFSREKCKWQVCSGQWGKNGCPSYVKPDPQY
jgi:hypothetical protein